MKTLHGEIALEARRSYPTGPGYTSSGAFFSPCRRWRYFLWRRWGPGRACCFIGLNPSTATETLDDPTIRRCIRFSKDWGYDAYWMLNLFAWRSTDPKGIYTGQPVGLHNDAYIVNYARKAGKVVVAWGNHGTLKGRGNKVVEMLAQAHVLGECFDVTLKNQPKHPLYVRADAKTKLYIPF